MRDGFNRDIDYLKISLTNKCNLKCVYCISENYRFLDDEINKFLSLEDYKFIIESMAKLGIKKIEFTGGEATLNSNLLELIYFAKNKCNMEEIILTTNGSNFYEQAYDLKKAGLTQVNIGINSLKEYRYNFITRGGNLSNVLNSFNTALDLGIKVNVDVLFIKSFNEDEIYDFIQLSNNFPITLRFFELMSIGESKEIFESGYINMTKFLSEINELEKFDHIYYKVENAKGRICVVSNFDMNNCSKCNNVILSYDGKLRFCTYSGLEYDILPYLHKPLTFSEIIKDIVINKPKDFSEIRNVITCRNLNEI